MAPFSLFVCSPDLLDNLFAGCVGSGRSVGPAGVYLICPGSVWRGQVRVGSCLGRVRVLSANMSVHVLTNETSRVVRS